MASEARSRCCMCRTAILMLAQSQGGKQSGVHAWGEFAGSPRRKSTWGEREKPVLLTSYEHARLGKEAGAQLLAHTGDLVNFPLQRP